MPRRNGTPQVSVVILAHSNAVLLQQCIESIARVDVHVSREVIVLLNGATKEVEATAGRLRGIRLLRSDCNLGFAVGNNVAVAHARGEYIVLLNDDTEVEPEWLSALIDVAEGDDRIGVVGSRMLFPDGTLQEAGSIIWHDGSALGIGRGLPAHSLHHLAIRDTDYCSACSLLIRRSLWDALGGLSHAYHPAYYEDVDFCLRAQRRGFRVVYCPQSRVRHHEGSSSAIGFRHVIGSRNHARFFTRWKSTLIHHETAAPQSPSAVRRAILRAARRDGVALIIDDRLPNARVGSGFGRLGDAAADLVASDYWVEFWAPQRSRPDANALGRLGVEVVDDNLDHHLTRPEHLYDAVIISRPHNIERYLHVVRRSQPQAAVIYDAEALFHRRLERQVAFCDPDRATAVDSERARFERLERGIRRKVDAVVSVSPDEADVFRAAPGTAPVADLPPLLRWARWTNEPATARSGAIFVAAWLAGGDSPNADGLRWFASAILPAIRRQIPGFQLTVTGDDPPESIRRLAAASGLRLEAATDLRRLYKHARLSLVPLRFGSGVKIKTIESVQFGVPVVATPVGAEGLPVDNLSAVTIAADSNTFAAAVVSLMSSDIAWTAAQNDIKTLLARLDARVNRFRWSDLLLAARLHRRPEAVRAERGTPYRQAGV